MSKSDDYLDQLLKGVTDTDDVQTTTEQSMDDEFAELLGTISDQDIFADDSKDEEDFLRNLEEEMAKVDEEEEKEDILSLFEGLDSIWDGLDSTSSSDESGDEQEDFAALIESLGIEESFTDEEAEIAEELETAVAEELEMDADGELEATVAEELEMAVDGELEIVADEESEVAAAEEEEVLDIPSTDELADLFSAVQSAGEVEGGFSIANLFADDPADEELEEIGTAEEKPMFAQEDEEPQEDEDVLKILEGLDGIDLELDDEPAPDSPPQDFSALESLFATDTVTNSEKSETNPGTETAKSEVNTKKKKKDAKKNEKKGFMAKLGHILFGEDEEEDEEPKKGASNSGAQNVGQAGEQDGENHELLKAFGDTSGTSGESAGANKKEKKKKEKKEKKEKVKKEKQPRPKKEKKPKQPKEPDNTPPLPKKPAMLIFVMVASVVALVMIGADLLGYANQIITAKDAYTKKNYTQAFAELSGMKMKDEDLALYEKYKAMSMVSAEFDAYDSLMKAGIYDMALDCLVRTVGRAEKYHADAELYGCLTEMQALEAEAVALLEQEFGVTKEQAIEFYSVRTRQDYSVQLLNVLKECGLER